MIRTCSAFLLVALLAVPAAAAAPEGCWRVTRSADTVFRKGLKVGQRAAASAEAARRGCDTNPVPDGTPGAVNADQARALLPEVRRVFPDAKPALAKRARPVKGKKATAKVKQRPRPAPRPVTAPAAPVVAPSAVPTTVPAIEPPKPQETVIEPATRADPPAPIVQPTEAPAEPAWRRLLRRLW